ncbi:MAG: ABC transporter permease [Bacillota bacterium]|nr:ABC transporter permease [Bacillota bacterium]
MKMNHRKLLLFCFAGSLLLLLVICLLGLLIPESAVSGSFLEARQAPSWEHPFGTDAMGRDLFLRTLKGLSTSMMVGLAASLISAFIALLVGVATVLPSRLLDSCIRWIIDLFMSIPHTVLIILISFSLGRGLKGLLVGIAATHWCSLARLVRAEVLQLRNQHYVAVSRRLGKSGSWILRHHLLPHLAPHFLVGMVLLFPHAILHEASVSFLGFGMPPEQPAIGMILSESLQYISAGMWWSALFPGLLLVLIVLLFDRLGENLRKQLDPYSAQE